MLRHGVLAINVRIHVGGEYYDGNQDRDCLTVVWPECDTA